MGRLAPARSDQGVDLAFALPLFGFEFLGLGVAAPGLHRLLNQTAQFRPVEVPLQPSFFRERDYAGLFRDDHHERVAVFSDADRGAVARAEFARNQWVLRQREKAASRSDAVIADDNRIVVQSSVSVDSR